MGNEMGNSNVSELKEEENKVVEALENSSQQTNHVDDVKGENQIVPAGEGTDLHENDEGLSSDNPAAGGDPPLAKRNSDDEKEKDYTEVKPSSQFTDSLLVRSNDGDCQDSGIQYAVSPEDVKYIEEEVESDLEKVVLGSSDDYQIKKQTSTRKDEEEPSNSTDGTASEPLTTEPLQSAEPESNDQDQHSEVHVEPPEDAFIGSPEKGILLETEATHNLTETLLSGAKIDGENTKDDTLVQETASQEKLPGVIISNDRRETETGDEVENGFDNKFSEEVHGEMTLCRNGSSKPAQEAIFLGTSSNTFEELPQPLDQSILLAPNKEEVESISEKEGLKHHPNPIQSHYQPLNESMTDEANASDSEYLPAGSNCGNGKEVMVDISCDYDINKLNGNSKGIEKLIEMSAATGTVPTELTVTQDNNEEAEEQTKEKAIKAIEEREESLKALVGTEAREKPEEKTVIFPNAGNEAEDSGVELRKSPSFDFDLSVEARSEESDQTPLLHRDRTRTRSLSILDGGASFGYPIQNQAISAEEKTIEVERSDSDRSRAPFLNFLKKEEEKANVEVKPKNQDCEKEGVEESWTGTSQEVALTKGSGKRKPRPSLFTTCICCAAVIN